VSENPETAIDMRAACPACGEHRGKLKAVGHQDTVRCAGCGRHCYNAPRTETGRPTRRVKTRDGMAPGLRAAILERATGRCELCGRGPGDGELHVSHLLSVADGTKLGLDSELLDSPENLACFCDSCNLGQGRRSASPRLLAALLLARGCL
jgi:hypothetical protein